MTSAAGVKIGYVQAGGPRSGHRGGERGEEGLPPEVQVEHTGMNTVMDFSIKSSYDANRPLIGRKPDYLKRVPEAVKEGGWQAVTIMGWPVQMMNPGLLEEVRTLVDVPVTSAAHASSTALKALGAKRILLMTPWDDTVDVHLRHYLTTTGIEVVTPRDKPYDCIANALAVPPDEVRALTAQAFREASWVQAIYFQAPLASYPVLDAMEKDLGVPIVTSNLSALWYMLSSLGKRYSLPGRGRLLSEWPAKPG